MSITNIKHLRDHMLNLLARVENDKEVLVEAESTAKVCASILGTLKIEMDYNKMLGQTPNIPFLDVNNFFDNVLDGERTLHIEDKRKR
jgi:hypothetical protein